MLTPADIENKEFKKEMRGYNMTEVNIFLKEVAMSYEKIYQENLSAMDRIGMLQFRGGYSGGVRVTRSKGAIEMLQ